MSTRDDILSLLRREALTIPELLERLHVTRNAVIVPLRQLEAEGLIEGSERRQNRVGKPAMQYSVVAGQEDIASGAYPTFAELTMQNLSAHLSGEQVLLLMQQVGKNMAAAVDVDEASDFSKRLGHAREFLDGLGAETVAEESARSTIIRSYSCPLGRAVRQESCVCSVVAAFLSEVTGTKVDEECDRGGKLFCKFVITR